MLVAAAKRFKTSKTTILEMTVKTKEKYSQVPIKQVGPNKRVGWVF